LKLGRIAKRTGFAIWNGCVELGQQKINDVPLCRADSDLRIRFAQPDEVVLYRRQAAEPYKSSDNELVYLIELDVVVSFPINSRPPNL
jgi:hypothetical protein